MSARLQRSRLFQLFRPLLAIVAFTWLDAWRNRWWAAMLGLVCATGLLSIFTTQLALTESAAVSTATYAPVIRLSSLLVVVVFVASAVTREFSERSILLALSAPLGRATWVVGKCLGVCALAWASAGLSALPLFAWGLMHAPGAAGAFGASGASATAVLAWTLSLALELTLMACVTLMFAMALRQAAASILSVLAFYVVSRLIGVFLLLSERWPADAQPWLQSFCAGLLSVISAFLPRLDLFTRTDWLLAVPASQTPAQSLITIAVQTGLYAALALVVAIIDFRNNDA